MMHAVAALFLQWAPVCGQCERSGLAEDDFSRTQLAKAAEERRCNECLAYPPPNSDDQECAK